MKIAQLEQEKAQLQRTTTDLTQSLEKEKRKSKEFKKVWALFLEENKSIHQMFTNFCIHQTQVSTGVFWRRVLITFSLS